MDSLSLGGYLGGFVIAGILLPICVSFVLDGIVMYFRGRGPFRLFVTFALTLALVGLYVLACENAVLAGTYAQLAGSVGLILWFSIAASTLGFGVRMLAMFLNPATKALDEKAIAERKAKHEARLEARSARAHGHSRGATTHA
jgi:hypothetical protein